MMNPSAFVSRARTYLRRPSTYSKLNNAKYGGMLLGENGTLEYSHLAVNDPIVALFFALVRALPRSRVEDLTRSCLSFIKQHPRGAESVIADLIVLTFQTRDCRGGKGERTLFHTLFLDLFRKYPETMLKLVPLIAEYGSFKDYFHLLGLVSDDKAGDISNLKDPILGFVATTLLADQELLLKHQQDGKEGSPPISLCAKYAPREGSSFHRYHKEAFKQLLARMFPNEDERKHKHLYRSLVAKLTAALGVVEVKMCRNEFASIPFEQVPSLCMKKYTKAFLNERLDCNPFTEEEVKDGNRFPEREDRVEARKRLLDHLSKGGSLKGGQLFPHEITRCFMSSYRSFAQIETEVNEAEVSVAQAQWNSLKESVVAQIAARKPVDDADVSNGSSRIDFGKLIPLVDVSGSMSGEPMEVAIALGILISELTHPAFRDRLLTFETSPSWVNLAGMTTIQEKVQMTEMAPWGGSTDIEKAFQLIEDVVRFANIPAKDIPDLIIFSDMQFDAAVGRRHDDPSTQLQRIEDRFHKLGMEMTGTPFKAPRIIFWNLQGGTAGFPATSDTPNVQMLSGYSPALFKAVVEGNTLPICTPYDTVRKVLDAERYDAIREVLSNSTEHLLAKYRFDKPVEEMHASKKARR